MLRGATADNLPRKRSDARTGRWREHRLEVRETFVAYLVTSVSALVEAHARLNGIVVDADAPVRVAFSRV